MYEIYFLHVVKHTQIHLFDSVCWAGTPGHAKVILKIKYAIRQN